MKAFVILIMIVFLSGCVQTDPISSFKQTSEKSSDLNYIVEYLQSTKTSVNGEELIVEIKNIITKKGDNFKIDVYFDDFLVESRTKSNSGSFRCDYMEGEGYPVCRFLNVADNSVSFDTTEIYKTLVQRGVMSITKSESSFNVNGEDRICDFFEYELKPEKLSAKDMSLFSGIVESPTEQDLSEAAELLKEIVKESKSSFCLDKETGLILKTTSFTLLHDSELNLDVEQESYTVIKDLRINGLISDTEFDLPRDGFVKI